MRDRAPPELLVFHRTHGATLSIERAAPGATQILLRMKMPAGTGELDVDTDLVPLCRWIAAAPHGLTYADACAHAGGASKADVWDLFAALEEAGFLESTIEPPPADRASRDGRRSDDDVTSAAKGRVPWKPNVLAIVPPYTVIGPPAGAAALLGYLRSKGCQDFDFLDLRLAVPSVFAPTFRSIGAFGETYVMDVPDLPLVLKLLKAIQERNGTLRRRGRRFRALLRRAADRRDALARVLGRAWNDTCAPPSRNFRTSASSDSASGHPIT